MRYSVSVAKCGLLASSLLVAMAAAAAPAERMAAPLREAMQRDLGLTAAQLKQYVQIERVAGQQEKRQAAALGRDYGGSWIEKDAAGNFRFVVATTSPRGQAPVSGVEYRVVRHRLGDLESAKAQLDATHAGSKAPGGVYGWFVDVRNNAVAVTVGRGHMKDAIDFVAASGIDAGTVRMVVENERPMLHQDLKGGHGYLRNPGDGYLYACSIGFTVTQGGYVTAGHCGDAGEAVYYEPSQWTLGPKIGNFVASNFPNPGQTGNDYAWVRTDAGHNLLGTVYGWGSGDVAVKGSTSAAVGAAVCRSGRTTKWRCGTIEAKAQTVNYGSGETILNLTRTSACSEGGDSGGSFITTAGQAQGVLSGGSGSCKGGGKRSKSYFQPVGPILSAYGLTLKTS